MHHGGPLGPLRPRPTPEEGPVVSEQPRHERQPSGRGYSPGDAGLTVATNVISRYCDAMTRQTTVRLPEDLAQEAEAVARVRGSSVNQLVVDSLRAEIRRVRADEDFTARAMRLIERDRELLDRLAQ